MRRAALTRTELVLVGAGGVGALVLLLTGFVTGGDDRWPWASAPLFVYGAFFGLLAAAVLALLGRTSGPVLVVVASVTVVNAVSILLAGGGSTAAALLVLVCTGLVVVGCIDLQRGARPAQR